MISVYIKQQVQSAQSKATLAVNSTLIQLYCNLGKMFADKQSLFEGRNNYVEQLANDLGAEFPEMTVFSRANLFFIRKFYQFYVGSDSVLQPVRLELGSNSVQQAVGLKEIEPSSGSVQQAAALNNDGSVQQAVGLENLFEPEFAGKMNFYLSVVDNQIKTEHDQPSIGIILCKNKNKLEVEYALQGMTKPIGVSDFTVTQALPAELKSTLPTLEEFENELYPKENGLRKTLFQYTSPSPHIVATDLSPSLQYGVKHKTLFPKEFSQTVLL